MTALEIQKTFNSTFAGYNKRGGIINKARASKMYSLYTRMNEARKAEGIAPLILPSLESRFRQYSIA